MTKTSGGRERLHRFRLALVAILLSSACLSACRLEVGEDEDIDASVEAMLDRSAAAWNAGDLDGFMESFADAGSTSFMTGAGPIYGHEAIREAYAPLFAPGAARDSLSFEAVEVRTLPPLVGIVTVRYVLVSEDGGTNSGWASLVVRRIGDGWRIVHDHSS